MIQFIRSEEGRRLGKLLAGVLPPGAEVVGHVIRDMVDEGAIVRLQNGNEVQMNAGVIRSLPRMGRPREGAEPKARFSAMVSAETMRKIEAARKCGEPIGKTIDRLLKGDN